MKLMILICTLPERHAKLKRLTMSLDKQLCSLAGYKVHDAGRFMSTGQKRNQLIEQTQSDYFSFVDDDDLVSDNYVESILKATESNPDVITFNGYITTNGADRRNFTIRLGSRYYEDKNDKNFYYHRFPNHIACFRRDKVRHVKFPHIWQQEDFQWADRIRASNILRTEVHINDDLYWYDYNTKQHVPTRIRR